MIRTVIKYKDNKILLDDAEVFEIYKKLLPGMYDMEFDKWGVFENFLSLKTPRVYPLMPSSELKNIQDYIEIFLSDKYEKLCKDTNILRKSGILLHGKPGIGKSNYINFIVKKSTEDKNACVFNVNTIQKLTTLPQQLRNLREIQDELFIIILEEIDELLLITGVEGMLKNLIDGIDSINNSLFLASTNYIDKIPKSLTERPSRFKKVLAIEQSPEVEEVKSWLGETYKIFLPDLEHDECEELHDKCINKSIDEIKHILIDYKMGIESFNQKKQRLGFKKV